MPISIVYVVCFLFSLLLFFYLYLFWLTASVTGGTYTSVTEQKIDDELEAARQARDKLGGVAEQWRIAANLLRTSAKGAMLGAESWNLVGTSRYDTTFCVPKYINGMII